MPASNGRFIVAAMENPKGYRPGLYFYVLHTTTGRKVSRYLRRVGSAFRKADKYGAWYAAGDRFWPEVDRCDELRTNPDAVPTYAEMAKAWLRLGCASN